MTSTPAIEFSRPLQVDRVPKTGSDEAISADPKECAALARRIAIPNLYGLSAKLHVSPWRGGGLKVEGELEADLQQVSVVSLEPFRHNVKISVLRFFLSGSPPEGEDEADVDPIVGGEVDLGELVAETLALELDPYPRRPGEAFAAPDDSKDEPEKPESPFAALARLKPSRDP